MNAPQKTMVNWPELNRKWLVSELERLRRAIDPSQDPEPAEAGEAGFEPALEHCALLFGLSRFERDLLLLAAGVELDGKLRQAVAKASSLLVERGIAQPTFALAFATLADPHWDAMSPQAPLRRWKLIEMEEALALALQPLFVDERILHFISGVPSFDERLQGLVRFVPARPLVDSGDFPRKVARALREAADEPPLVVLEQDRLDPSALAAAAADVLAALPAPGLWILARDLPSEAPDLANLALRIDREASLTAAVAVVELEPNAPDLSEQERRTGTLFSHLVGPALLLGSLDRDRIGTVRGHRIVRANVPDPGLRCASETAGGRTARALGPALQQFHLSSAMVASVVERLGSEAPADEDEPALARRAWGACREAARGGLDTLAQRVSSRAGFEDLVLPESQLGMLGEIAQHLRHRAIVYDDWGMRGKTLRGHGLCVLFVGESGTGKTLAAEAIANEAMLDLYRIDLATVVSKYIGETEKNLKRLFDAAEASGAVLLFDEADALYGKRSDVKDSHDRYANIEIAYLLQRIEAYRGLAILTTNFRSALDRAFLRRIRFIVQFPFPDLPAREQIWRRELPETAPQEPIDFAALSRMQMSGGHIRTVAINAAFMAAAESAPISMAHLRRAAQREAAKLERPLLEASLGGAR
jgi:hypothetical protein